MLPDETKRPEKMRFFTKGRWKEVKGEYLQRHTVIVSHGKILNSRHEAPKTNNS